MLSVLATNPSKVKFGRDEKGSYCAAICVCDLECYIATQQTTRKTNHIKIWCGSERGAQTNIFCRESLRNLSLP